VDRITSTLAPFCLLGTLYATTAFASDENQPDLSLLVPPPDAVVQLQTWFTPWDQDEDPQADGGGYGDPEFDVGFAIPRARLGLQGHIGVLEYRLTMGTAQPFDLLQNGNTNIQVVDAWTKVRLKSALGDTVFALGQHTVPFSREMAMSSDDLVFQERSVSGVYLAPNRDIGFSASQDLKWFRLSAGVFNGGGDILGNDDNGVLVSSRLELTFGKDEYKTNSTEKVIAIGGGYLYDHSIAENTHLITADLLGRIAGLSLLASYNQGIINPTGDNTVLPPTVPEKTIRRGVSGQIAWYGLLPKNLGGIEPAVRFSWYDDATHLQDNGDVGILHAGVSWREPIPFIDVGVGYIHRMEFEGRQINNDSLRVWIGFKYPGSRTPMRLANVFEGIASN